MNLLMVCELAVLSVSLTSELAAELVSPLQAFSAGNGGEACL